MGKTVAIIEPFYKTWMDGMTGVLFPKSLGPPDIQGLHDEGNALFRAGYYHDAVPSYRRALQQHVSSGAAAGLMTKLLLCHSECLVALKQPAHALACATAALALDSACSYAYRRAALALDAMKHYSCAKALMGEAVATSGFRSGSGQGKEFMAELSDAARAAPHAPPEDVLSIITTEVMYACDVFSDARFSDAGRAVTGKSLTSRSGNHTVEDEARLATCFGHEGGRALREGKLGQAKESIAQALGVLHMHRRKASTLLNNRSACHLRIGIEASYTLFEVMRDSCAAILLDYTQPKSYHKAASAMMLSGGLQSALDIVKEGLKQSSGDRDLARLERRRASMIAGAPTL
ncbi:MAG: hypothetical protein WDW38_000976 [Sanguina aurantia]